MNHTNSITKLEFAIAAAYIADGDSSYSNRIDLAILTLWPKGATSMRLTDVCVKLELAHEWTMSRQLQWYFKTMRGE